ncbi:MAG: hypothetical protein LBJ72_05165 [Dysgonamonadaceae bacterium]|jgi:L-2,4-diaminobutyrate decarboxylase|nr:hypothetical protein [Dysgonamonadaceae bacterium]
MRKTENEKAEGCEVSLDPNIFDPELFGEHAGIAVAYLKSYMNDVSVRGLNLIDPPSLIDAAKKLMTKESDTIAPFDEKRFRMILDLYIGTGIPVYSTGYMGRQFSGVVPLAGIFDLVSSISNQPASFYEAGQLPNVAEQIMSTELNRFIGFEDKQFTMVSTSGGSLANLTALLAARNDKLPGVWSNGMPAGVRDGIPAIAISEDAHYSITRAAGILGIGESRIIRLPVNRAGQIRAEKVQAILDEARAGGLNVFCLVASAGTTSMGAFDPIEELSGIAKKNDMWLHVDGAHGGGLLVSDKFRYRLKGIENADSLTWDAHKMLFVPAPCSLLFYKNKEKSYGAFKQEASYVFEDHADIYSEYEGAEKNFECTKRPSIMNLWLLWAMHGKALFAEKIGYLCRLCRDAYELLNEEPDFEIIHEPECNILCFRYKPQNMQEYIIPDFQIQIRNRIRSNGMFFISKVNIHGETALRAVFMNHEIKSAHFRLLLEQIRQAGQLIINEHTNIILNEQKHGSQVFLNNVCL